MAGYCDLAADRAGRIFCLYERGGANGSIFDTLALTLVTADPPIDWDRATQLYQRDQRGEKLSPDDQAYLDRAKAERQKMQNGPAPAAQSSIGLTPLTDLKEKYKGESGGLYGNNSNEPP